MTEARSIKSGLARPSGAATRLSCGLRRGLGDLQRGVRRIDQLAHQVSGLVAHDQRGRRVDDAVGQPQPLLHRLDFISHGAILFAGTQHICVDIGGQPRIGWVHRDTGGTR